MAGELKKEINTLEPDGKVTMYTIDAQSIGGEIYRFHAHATEGVIRWQGEDYHPWPMEAKGFGASGSGKATSPTITIANVDGKITPLIIFFDSLLGARFERRRTLAKFLDGRPEADPNEEFPTEIWTINQKTGHNKNQVIFNLSSPMDFKQRQLPGRQIMANQCPWRYRGTDCGYNGPPVADQWDIITTDADQDMCSGSVQGCKFRFGEDGELRTGAFPAAGLVR